MKTFKTILSEVAQPKAPEEKAFKDQHKVELIDYPSPDSEQIFKGTIKPKKRFADYVKGEDEKAYDQAYVDKVEESVEELSENPMEEIPMMMGQLRFISFAAEEIMEFLEMARNHDPEEWYQNKLASTHAMMKTLHAYMEGKRQEMGIDMDDIMAGYYRYESLEEALKIKPGTMTLDDGSKVKVSRQDAQLLNNMLGDMNGRNRREMEKVLMTDPAGFNEIVGFAREAL